MAKRKNTRTTKARGTSFAIIAATAALVGIVVLLVVLNLFEPPESTGEKIIVEIPQGAGLLQIASLLEQEKAIKSAKVFISLAKFKGQGEKIKAGEYEIRIGQSPSEILDKLVRGEVLLRQLTIPEGYTLYQVAEAFADNGLGEYKALLGQFENGDYSKKMGIEADRLEGYLFPETYAFIKGASSERMAHRMVKQFFKVFNEEKENKSLIRPFSTHEVLTLASICEKEAKHADELPMIARVYLNRLALGMPLQADPTVVYGLKKFDAPLSRNDLKRPSPYNTYLHKGLPPGPICNPGRLAIRSVFNPAEGNALYFVAKPDGYHHFSSNYDQHLAAIKKYRR